MDIDDADLIAKLVRANALESDAEFLAAAELCEQCLNGRELPDHYFTIARNYFNLASRGDETYAWKALLAALEGVDRRAMENGQTDVQYASGIIRWVLDHFADWYRIDVPSFYRNAWFEDQKHGLEPNSTMRAEYRQHVDDFQTKSRQDNANKLLAESSVVVRPGRSPESIDREACFLMAGQFSPLIESGAERYLEGMSLPMPGGFDHQLYDKYLYTAAKAEMHWKQACARGVPGIFLACMPKSASEFLCYTLADVLAAPITRVTIGSPFRGRIFSEWVAKAANGGCVLHDHFCATDENVTTLRECGVHSVSVLIRDPRAVVWSMRKMAVEVGGNQGDRAQFHESVQSYSQWIGAWLAAAQGGMAVKFIRFQDLINAPARVMEETLIRFGAGAFVDRLAGVLAARGKGSNFRSGDDESWRRHVTSEVAADAWAGIAPGVRDLLDLKP